MKCNMAVAGTQHASSFQGTRLRISEERINGIMGLSSSGWNNLLPVGGFVAESCHPPTCCLLIVDVPVAPMQYINLPTCSNSAHSSQKGT